MPDRSILATLVAVLALWCGSAVAQPVEVAPEAVTPAPAAVAAPSAFDLVLKEGKRLSSQGRYYDAALVYHKILAEGEEASSYFQEAQYEMGVALYELKFYVSSFGYFDRVVDTGTSHSRYVDALPWLVRIHRQLPGETNTLFRMSAYDPAQYPAEYSEEISFYVGQYYYYEGNLQASLDALLRVGPSQPELFIRALYLKGVVHVRKGEAAPAAQAFNEVLRYVKDRKTPESMRYGEMATMAVARTFYGAGQKDPSSFAEAIRNYDQVPDSSDQWLDSLFEKSWAYYQEGDFTRALGNILTINSPYFEEEFYPEASVLKAVIFFKNCLYEEALVTIDPFYKEYYEIMKELDSVLKVHTDPADFYQYLASISRKGTEFPLKIKKIFNAALADRKLRRLFGFVVNISTEMQQLEELRKQPVARSLVDFLLPDLIAYRGLTMGEAGKLARERLARVNRELRSLLQQALAVRFETVNAQKGILSERSRREQVMEARGSQKPDEIIPVSPEHVRWPFDGEYWKDELGSYRYPLRSVCGAAN
jgi:tetratricopeptide (TPR) repeat protein